MNTRTTLLLLLLAAALYGGMRLYETKVPGRWQRASQEGVVLHFQPDNIDGIEIENNGERIKLKRRDTGWELTSPVKDRANAAVVSEILALAQQLRKEATLEESELNKRALKDFGVAKASLRLKLRGKNAPPELFLGKETAVEKKIYARLENAKTVYVVTDELRNALTHKVDEFRDRALTTLQGPHIYRVVLKTAAGEMELLKEANQWMLKKPLQSRANNQAAVDLVGSILATPIVAFAPDQGANLNAYGLAEPRATVTLWSVSQDEPLTLEIGASDEKGELTYARASSRQSVCLLPARVERLLTLRPNDLRDRHLLRVELDIVDRITLAPADGAKVVIQRKGESWLVLPDRPGARADEGRPANTREVEALVAALQSREITHFVNDVAADLAPYGLDAPQLRVTFSSYASATTAEGTAGEEPIVTLAFGKVEGDQVYARAENEPFVVSLDRSILDLIPTQATPWLSATPFRFDPKQVTALELVRGEKRITFSAGVEEGGAPVQSLVNTLSTLSPLRRLAEPVADEAKRGEIIVTVTGRDEPLRITLGTPNADGTCPISVAGEPGSFLLSAPDASALTLPLPE